MHRGTTVVNSNFIDAIVVYTGKDTKLVQNQGKYLFKQSQLEKAFNWIVTIHLFFIFIMAGIMTSFAFWFNRKYEKNGGPRDGAYYIFYGNPQ